jgi:hypothetical protein
MYLATILGSIGVLNLVVSYFFGVAGLTYGLVDQGVLMLGAYLGWELDPWIASRFKGARNGLGVLIGALVGNTISDCAGAILDPDMRVMVFGITNGCLIPLLFVPLIEKMKARRTGWGHEEKKEPAVVEDHYGYGSLYGEEGDSWLNNVKPISEWGHEEKKEPASEEDWSDYGSGR